MQVMLETDSTVKILSPRRLLSESSPFIKSQGGVHLLEATAATVLKYSSFPSMTAILILKTDIRVLGDAESCVSGRINHCRTPKNSQS